MLLVIYECLYSLIRFFQFYFSQQKTEINLLNNYNHLLKNKFPSIFFFFFYKSVTLTTASMYITTKRTNLQLPFIMLTKNGGINCVYDFN